MREKGEYASWKSAFESDLNLTPEEKDRIKNLFGNNAIIIKPLKQSSIANTVEVKVQNTLLIIKYFKYGSKEDKGLYLPKKILGSTLLKILIFWSISYFFYNKAQKRQKSTKRSRRKLHINR